MTVKQKATKWLAHFALALILVMGTVTTGSAEAAAAQATKAVIKIIKKILKGGKSTTQKGPSAQQQKTRNNDFGRLKDGVDAFKKGRKMREKARCGDEIEEDNCHDKKAEESQNSESASKGQAKDG